MNENVNIPNGVDLSKLNIAFELVWLNVLFKEKCITEEQYNKLKLVIKNKYL